MRARWLCAALVLLVASSCAPRVDAARAQWVVHIATDAPVPGMGDRILIEVLDEKGSPCSACRREFGVATSDRWPLSFGIQSIAGQSPPSVRVTFYRAATVGSNGLVGTDRRIEQLVHLPPADGDVHVALKLSMSCFGALSSFERNESCDPETGRIERASTLTSLPGDAASIDASLPKPGSWGPSLSVPCEGEAPEGMVCVPGGAFLMGRFPPSPLDGLSDVPEQLVKLSPYFLDVDEVSVARMRALVASGSMAAPPGRDQNPGCTYTTVPTDTSEAFPIDCVSLAMARAACAALGKRLPSEAEWEFAASNRSAESRYPWTTPDRPCAVSVVGNGRADDPTASQACEGVGAMPGLRAGGSAADVTDLQIRNMGGSLSEWIEDTFVDYSDPQCWGPDAGLRINPRCTSGAQSIVRGGSWATDPVLSESATRDTSVTTEPRDTVGFRCAQ